MVITARRLALATVLGGGALVAVALAEPPRAPGRAAPPSAAAPAADRLPPRSPPEDIPSLTAAQREQIASLHRQTRQQLAPQREQLQRKRLELRALWLAEPPSESAIVKKLAEIDTLRASMRPVLVKSRLAHLALLTRAQRAALGQPSRPRECPHGAGHRRHTRGHEITPHAEGMMPWLDHADDLEWSGDCALDADGTVCPEHEPGPPGPGREVH